MAELPKLVPGARYGPETLNQYRPGNKGQGKIVRRPGDTGPHWYQPKNQADYDRWQARGDTLDAKIDAKRGVALAKEAASMNVDNSGLTKEPLP
jgi:hypothetical protein